MVLTRRNFLIIRCALFFSLIGGTFGVGLPVKGLPARQSDSCKPNTGWTWTRGAARPEVAQQAEAALKNQGMDVTVVATEYGEKDSCGTFELFSTDFAVTLKKNSNYKQSPQAQSELADNIRAALAPFGGPQVGNVRIDPGDGTAQSYPSSSSVQNAPERLAATSGVSASANAALNRKVFLLV